MSILTRLLGGRWLRPRTGKQKKPPRLRMVRTFDETDWPLADTPQGCRLVHFQPGQEADWIELFNASEEFGTWDQEKLRAKILSGLIPSGGLLVEYGHEFIATASACRWERFDPYAVLEYVVVHPDFRSKGLGRTVVAGALDAARRAGFPGMVLETDDFRLPAIRVYLKLGFKPDLEALPETQKRWRRVLQQVPHPT